MNISRMEQDIDYWESDIANCSLHIRRCNWRTL